MDGVLGVLGLLAVSAYIPLGRFALRRFDRRMQGRQWLPKHSVFYATLAAFLFAPGCLVVDLMHGNSFPLPVPAWIALAAGSIWGGALPLCVGWMVAYARAKDRMLPGWSEDAEPPA